MAPALFKAHKLASLTSAASTLRHKPRFTNVSVFAASTLSKTEKQAKRQPREENVGLESKKAFYVDHTCIGQYLCTHDTLSSVLTLCSVIRNTHCCSIKRFTRTVVAWTSTTPFTYVQTVTHAGGLHQSSLAARMSSQP